MPLSSSYRMHNYMGEYANDSDCLTFIRANKWDSTGNGSGNPRPGIQYFNTTSNKMRVYNGTAWVDFAGSIDVDTNYYVDGTDGNDSNDGLSWGAAKKTFGFLIDGETDSIPKCINADVVVYFKNNIRARNSKGNLKLEGFFGSGSLTIEGVLTEEETFTASGYDNNQANQDARFWVSDSTKSWTTNEWRRHFVDINGNYFPVFSNTDTRLNLAMGRSLTGTPAGKIYSAPEILRELDSNPGVKYNFGIPYDLFSSVSYCDLKVFLKNIWMDENIGESGNNFWISYNEYVSLDKFSCSSTVFNNDSTCYCSCVYVRSNDYGGFGTLAKSYVQFYQSAMHCTDSTGYGLWAAENSSIFLMHAHVSGQLQGIASWESSSIFVQREIYLKDCSEAFSIISSNISFVPVTDYDLRIDNCLKGIIGTGDIYFQEGYTITPFSTTNQVVFGPNDIGTFSDLNALTLKSRQSIRINYVDSDFLSISKNEYNNTTSGLDAHNYQDAIDELAGDISGFAPDSASYWTSTAEAGLSAEINLGALSSGILKHTVSGGVSTPSIATAGTDYENALTFQHSLTRATNTINLVGDSATPGNSKYYGTNSGGTKGFYDLPEMGANTSLSNLSSVAINTTLLPGVNDGYALGSGTLSFSDLFLASGGVINFNNGDITLTHSTDMLTLGGGDLALGANNLTMTGSLGATSARLTKGWFTDLEVSNAIVGSITGNAATITAANETTDTECFITFVTTATGSQGIKTNAGLVFNSNTGGVGIGESTPSSKLDVNGDIEIPNTSWHYFGDPSTNGSWRMGVSGGNFIIQKREDGAWNLKHTFS